MKNFVILGDFINANPYGTGLVNDTFAVMFNQGGAPVRYILQRLNHNFFLNPVALMENIYRVTTHLHQKMLVSGSKRVTREVLTLIPPEVTPVLDPYFRPSVLANKEFRAKVEALKKPDRVRLAVG